MYFPGRALKPFADNTIVLVMIIVTEDRSTVAAVIDVRNSILRMIAIGMVMICSLIECMEPACRYAQDEIRDQYKYGQLFESLL